MLALFHFTYVILTQMKNHPINTWSPSFHRICFRTPWTKPGATCPAWGTPGTSQPWAPTTRRRTGCPSAHWWRTRQAEWGWNAGRDRGRIVRGPIVRWVLLGAIQPCSWCPRSERGYRTLSRIHISRDFGLKLKTRAEHVGILYIKLHYCQYLYFIPIKLLYFLIVLVQYM